MLPMSEMGLNEEFAALRNVVFKYKKDKSLTISSKYVKHSPEKISEINAQNRANFAAARAAGLPLPKSIPQYYWSYSYTTSEKMLPQASFGLQRVRDLMFGHGYEYLGKQDDKFVFFYDSAKYFPDGFLSSWGVKYPYKNTIYIYKKPDGEWVEEGKSEGMPSRVKIGSIFQTLTNEQVAQLLNISVEQYLELTKKQMVGKEENPDTDMCDIFIKISRNGDSYVQQVYINGLPEEQVSIGSLKAPWIPFNTGHGYVGTWILYNDSEKGTGASPQSLSSGNFGQSFYLRVGQKSDPKYKLINVVQTTGDNTYDAVNHVVSHNPTRQNCVLEFNIEFLPAQGKNMKVEAYYDLVQNKVRRNIVGAPIFE